MRTTALESDYAGRYEAATRRHHGHVRESASPYGAPEHGPGWPGGDLAKVLHGTVRALRRVEQRAPFHLLAGNVYLALKTLNRLRNLLDCTEATQVARDYTSRHYRRAGFSSFGDYAREVLGIAPRTARRRVALSRVLQASPTLRQRVIDGQISSGSAILLAPVLGTVDEPAWLEQAEHLPQRDLALALRSREDSPSQALDPAQPGPSIPQDTDPTEDCGRSMAFSAPVRVAAVWDHAMDTAERVLGWAAPRHLCVAALLDESAQLLAQWERDAASVAAGSAETGRSPGDPVMPDEPGAHAAKAAAPQDMAISHDTRRVGVLPAHARWVIAHLHETADLLASIEPCLTHDAPLHELGRAQRRIRRFEGTLLADVEMLDAAPFLGYGDVSEFAGHELGLSRSSVRNRLREAELLEEEEALRVAVESGTLGTGQAMLLSRVGAGSGLTSHVDRAAEVTHRQLQREVRVLERLQELAPQVAARYPGPLPSPGLAKQLLAAVLDSGPSADQVHEHLEMHGVVDVPDADPAASPTALRYLELLLDLLALGSPRRESQRNASAPAQTLAADTRRTTIRFWSPTETADRWDHAIRVVRAHVGPLPTWAAVVILLGEVLPQWTRHDPDTRPTEWKVLERDDYWCQAPACSARRNLEAHHIVYRSRSGSDAADNLVTLCHRHHRRGIHEGWARVEGSAPHALTWHLGSGSHGIPVRTYQGQLRRE